MSNISLVIYTIYFNETNLTSYIVIYVIYSIDVRTFHRFRVSSPSNVFVASVAGSINRFCFIYRYI